LQSKVILRARGQQCQNNAEKLMVQTLDPEPELRRRRKRKRAHRGLRLPKPFVLLLGLSAIGIVCMPYVREYFGQNGTPLSNSEPSPFEAGLTVSDIRMEEAQPHRISGVLHNANPHPYGPVRIAYSLWSDNHQRSGYARFTVDQVPANGQKPFVSGELPQNVANFYLEQIEADPVR